VALFFQFGFWAFKVISLGVCPRNNLWMLTRLRLGSFWMFCRLRSNGATSLAASASQAK